jgi:hypothetical protein
MCVYGCWRRRGCMTSCSTSAGFIALGGPRVLSSIVAMRKKHRRATSSRTGLEIVALNHVPRCEGFPFMDLRGVAGLRTLIRGGAGDMCGFICKTRIGDEATLFLPPPRTPKFRLSCRGPPSYLRSCQKTTIVPLESSRRVVAFSLGSSIESRAVCDRLAPAGTARGRS